MSQNPILKPERRQRDAAYNLTAMFHRHIFVLLRQKNINKFEIKLLRVWSKGVCVIIAVN